MKDRDELWFLDIHWLDISTFQKATLNLMVETELVKATACKKELVTLIMWHGQGFDLVNKDVP